MSAKKTARKKTQKRKSKKKSINQGLTAAPVISVWEQDPGLGTEPDGSQPVQLAIPQLNATNLPTFIENPATPPPVAIFSSGTPEFRYWTAASALGRGSAFWSALLPNISWQVGNKLPINLDAGIDLNAYYDRRGLLFFHKVVNNRTIFSGESPDVVCHEQGHAILDALKPRLWDAASIEVAAFHEALGDIASILCGLQLPTLRQAVLAETGGSLFRSSKLSRMAEQLGWAIRQIRPSTVDPDCLRNAVNPFFYRDPNTLPSSAPASSLSSESHSFSRVFTSAFMEAFAGMFKVRSQQDEQNLLQLTFDMGQILVKGIKAAAVVPTFFSQVAINMIQVAATDFPSLTYGQIIRLAFIKHGIIPPSGSEAFLPMSKRVADPQRDVFAETEELPTMRLAISEYGLGIENILVCSASEPKKIDVSGVSLGIGSVHSPSADEAAKSFVEDLLRRGRLKTTTVNATIASIMESGTMGNTSTGHDTHTHELREENGEYVLRRVRIDCGLC